MLILCTKLISLYRPDILWSILFTFKLIKRGLLACLPVTLLILTDCFLFLWQGAFLPKWPNSLIDVRIFVAACIVFLFLSFLFS